MAPILGWATEPQNRFSEALQGRALPTPDFSSWRASDLGLQNCQRVAPLGWWSCDRSHGVCVCGGGGIEHSDPCLPTPPGGKALACSSQEAPQVWPAGGVGICTRVSFPHVHV